MLSNAEYTPLLFSTFTNRYQEAFSISTEFALSHRRLNSIRGFNTKEGGLCISESSSKESEHSSKEP